MAVKTHMIQRKAGDVCPTEYDFAHQWDIDPAEHNYAPFIECDLGKVRGMAIRLQELEAENQRLRKKLMAVEGALGDIYDLWIEDADPQECQDAHNLVHKLLRDE